MLYPEFSPHFIGRLPVPGLRNIGWLDAERDFATGPIPGELVEKLVELRHRFPVRRLRGFYPCPVCAQVGLIDPLNGNDSSNWLGSSELWVPDGEGGWYCAPDRILHSIHAHEYKPPAPFVSAVCGQPLQDPTSAERAAVAWMRDQISAMQARGETLPGGPERVERST